MKRITHTARLFTRCLGPVSVAALALVACGSEESTTTTTFPLPPRIVVTSVKGDPQSELLAAIFARVLEDSGFRVGRKDPVDLDRAGYYQAIQDGSFQVIPETTADLLAFVYDQPGAEPAPTTLVPTGPATTQAPVIITTTTVAPVTTVADTTVDDTTADTTGDTTGDTTADTVVDTTVGETTTTLDPALTTTTTVAIVSNGRAPVEQVIAINAGMPSGLIVSNGVSAQDKPVVACTADAMAANADTELFTLTNLASIAPSIRLAAPADFWAEGTFERYYGGEFAEEVTVESADVAGAIADDSADCFLVDSLDPIITIEDLTVLTDDQYMVPSNAVVALMDSTIATPEAIFALDNLSAALTTERLNQMLNQILNNGADPVVVANAFVDTI